MDLVDGMNHLASVTGDLDRFTRFYRDVFDAVVVVEMEEDGLRHALVEVGPNTMLHPFQFIGGGPPFPEAAPMFQRGRLDHFGLNAAGEEAFHELRRRVVEAGASDGEIVDLGPAWSVSFTDPDGNENEIVWMKPGATWKSALKREDWPRIPYDG